MSLYSIPVFNTGLYLNDLDLGPMTLDMTIYNVYNLWQISRNKLSMFKLHLGQTTAAMLGLTLYNISFSMPYLIPQTSKVTSVRRWQWYIFQSRSVLEGSWTDRGLLICHVTTLHKVSLVNGKWQCSNTSLQIYLISDTALY